MSSEVVSSRVLNQTELSKLVVSFSQIALCICRFTSFRGLNRQLTNHAVGGSHLCLVRDTKRQTEYSVGTKKYRQPNSKTKTCRRFNISLYLITWEHNTPFARKRKQIKRHLPIVNLELEFLNVLATCYYCMMQNSAH